MRIKTGANLNKILKSSQSGFTLVELLIVIVIIGILAGVVIGVLNPVQQQNRARDGTTRAQLDKMALSAKSLYVSSPRSVDRSPNLAEFAGGIGSSPDVATNCTSVVTNAAANCNFTVSGQPLPTNCAANGYNNSNGATQCSFIYWRDPDEFIIAARGAANPATMFVYYYQENSTTGNVVEGFYSCPVTYAVGSGAPSGCSSF